MDPVFLEAIMYKVHGSDDDKWHDRSTAEDFIFESSKGVVRLRKRNAYPQTTAYIENDSLVLGYGNVPLGENIASQALQDVDESLFHTEESLYIKIDLSETQVFIQRDTLSALPLFVGYQDDRVVVSSEHSRVVELLDADKLRVDRVALLRYLCALDFTYATLFQDIVAVHDRMRFVWSGSHAKLEFAPHANVSEIIKDRRGSAHQLREMLESTLERYKERYASNGVLACEWSGGIDSSVVTGYLADQGYNVTTASMLLPGAEGMSQTKKLESFTSRFSVADTITVQLDAERHYRFQRAKKNNIWKPVDFREMSAYEVAHREYLESLQSQGFTSIFTGFGGDELCEENDNPHRRLQHDLSDPFAWHNRKPVWWTPTTQTYLENTVSMAYQQPEQTLPPVSPSMTTQGFRGNSLYIKHDIWPAHPLGDPLLYAYCQSLPLRYRVNKHLLKMYLEARRTPHSIYRGDNENFRNFYHTSAVRNTRPVLEMFLPASLLAAAGLIDVGVIMATHDRIASQPYSRKNAQELFDIIRLLNVETILQSSGVRSLT
jgi:hypothetical protein